MRVATPAHAPVPLVARDAVLGGSQPPLSRSSCHRSASATAVKLLKHPAG